MTGPKCYESLRIIVVLWICLPYGVLIAAEVTKWCSNETCLEPLFESTVTRNFTSPDDEFLQLSQGMKLKITSIMYSNRVDFMGAITPDGKIGKIYKNWIDHRPYVEFLKSAIESQRVFYLVSDVISLNKKSVKITDYTPLKKLYENKLEEMREEEKSHGNDDDSKAIHESPKSESVTIAPPPQTIPTSKSDKEEQILEPVTAASTTAKITSSAETPIVESFAPMNVKATAHDEAPVEEALSTSEKQLKLKSTTTPNTSQENIELAAVTASLNEADKIVGESSSSNQQSISKISQDAEPHVEIDPVIVHKAIKSSISASEDISSEPSGVSDSNNLSETPKNADSSNKIAQQFQSLPTIKSDAEKALLKTEASADNTEEEVAQQMSHQLPTVEQNNVLPSTTVAPENNVVPSTTISPTNNMPSTTTSVANNVPSTTTSPANNVVPNTTISPANNVVPSTTISSANDVVLSVISENKKENEPVTDVTSGDPVSADVPPKSENNPTTLTPTLQDIPTATPILELIPDDPQSITQAKNGNNAKIHAGAPTFAKSLVNAINNINKKREKTDTEVKNHISASSEENQQASDKSAGDGSEYCHKETCNSISEAMLADSLKLAGLYDVTNSTLRPILNAYIDDFRVLLPYPFSAFDNTGIIIFAFLFVVFTIRIISAALSGSGPQEDVVDKRLLHDCMTRLKEQEVELTKSRVHVTNSHQLAEAKAVVQKFHAANVELSAKRANLESELQKQADLIAEYGDIIKQNARHVQDLENALRSKDREIENLNSSNAALSDRNDELSAELSAALGQAESFRNEKETLQFELQVNCEKLNDTTKKLQISQEELSASKQMNSELQVKLDRCMIVIEELRQANASSVASTKKAKRGVKDVETKSADSSDSSGNVIVKKASNILMATDNDDDDAVNEPDEVGAGSGGSVAWSDFSEVDETDAAKKNVEERLPRKVSVESTTRRTKNTVRAELFEIADLKSQIRALESERDTLRTMITVEQKEKEGLSERLEQLKSDLADKRREAEQREAERFALQAQCQKMLHMVEEKDNKAHEKEEQLKQLHDRITQSERDLRKVEDEKREVASRVRELENSLRRSEDTNTKLENKIYHEDRRLNGKICQLEAQLSKLHSLSPNTSALSDLNLSGNSSDRDFAPSMPVNEIPSLWSDVGSDLQYDSLNELDRYRPNVSNLSALGNTASLRHRSSRKSLQMVPPSSNVDVSGGELSSRASPFELEQIWMNRNNSMKEKRNSGTYRARSRSTGRQSVPTGRQSARLVGLVPSPSSNLNALYYPK